MSANSSIGAVAPVMPTPETRIAQGHHPAMAHAAAPPHASPPNGPAARTESTDATSTDAGRIEAGPSAARDAGEARTEAAKDTVEIRQASAFENQVGLIDGTFAHFVDIVDPHYQQRIARVFGPADPQPAAAEAPAPAAVRKAYEHAPAAAGSFRQSA